VLPLSFFASIISPFVSLICWLAPEWTIAFVDAPDPQPSQRRWLAKFRCANFVPVVCVCVQVVGLVWVEFWLVGLVGLVRILCRRFVCVCVCRWLDWCGSVVVSVCLFGCVCDYPYTGCEMCKLRVDFPPFVVSIHWHDP